MKFAVYAKTAKLGFLQVANYRTEVWFQILQKILVLMGVFLLWSVIGSSQIHQSFTQIVAYFLIGNGVREFVDGQYGKFGSKIIDDIKAGSISSTLLQPTSTPLFLFSKNFGTRGVSLAFSLIYIIIGFFLTPPAGLLSCLLFLVCLISATIISYSQCIMVGSIAFWTTEAKGLKNVVNHVSRTFSGALIPLTFFPDALKLPVMLNPFASYAYLPATIIQARYIDINIVAQLCFSVFWATTSLGFSRMVWKKGVKRYEAIGL